MKWSKEKKMVYDWVKLKERILLGDMAQKPYVELDAMMARIHEFGTRQVQSSFASNV